MDCSLPCSSCRWNFSGKNIEVGCHFLLQRIFPTQGLNPCLLHWQADFLPLNHLGSPMLLLPNLLFPTLNIHCFSSKFFFFSAMQQGLQDLSCPPGIEPRALAVEVDPQEFPQITFFIRIEVPCLRRLSFVFTLKRIILIP